MKSLIYFSVVLIGACVAAACASENTAKDRSEACDMFGEITSLAKSYILKVGCAPDSAAWADVCMEFEDSLDKVNFKYPADTDLSLSEGQNDTIANLLRAYMKARDERLDFLMAPPALSQDSVAVSASR